MYVFVRICIIHLSHLSQQGFGFVPGTLHRTRKSHSVESRWDSKRPYNQHRVHTMGGRARAIFRMDAWSWSIILRP